MKKNARNLLIATTLLTMIVGGGAGLAVYKYNKKIEEERQKRNALINNLLSQNKKLRTLKMRYIEQSEHYADSAANYAQKNPKYDDMAAVYGLCVKMSEDINKKYQVTEKRFLKKVSSLGKKFCYPDGGYNFVIEGKNNYHRPVIIEDWMVILQDNASEVPNFSDILKEYERLTELEVLMEKFFVFVDWDMFSYVDNDSETKQNLQQDIVQIYNLGNSSLSEQTYYFVDSIHAFNNKDNVIQNTILKTLFDDFLKKFASYEDYGMLVMDKKLYQKIKDIALSIKKHNSIETGRISYDKAVEDANTQIQNNTFNIMSLQQHVK